MTKRRGGGFLSRFDTSQLRITRGARVRIENLTPTDALPIEADGDVRGRTPVEFRVLPRALRVVC